jgi:hypothetical protein
MHGHKHPVVHGYDQPYSFAKSVTHLQADVQVAVVKGIVFPAGASKRRTIKTQGM